MMFTALVLLAFVLATCNAFHTSFPTGRVIARSSSSSLRMNVPGGQLTSPGKNLKPMADGSFKEAGAHLKEYVLENENGARAVVRTYGGNCFSWTTKEGIQVMGTRKDCVKDDSKPYAGGAPHCFPQFGPGAIMQHGFARGMDFVPEERAKKLSFDRMIFKLLPTEETKKVWNHNFEYRFDITLRENSVEWDLIVINLGDQPFDITLGLHNYYDISSLKNVVVSGALKGVPTIDKVTGAAGVGASNDVSITAPVDMVWKGANGPVTITDTGKKTQLTLEQKGFKDTVIWSPYGNDAMGYDKFICVEPVCVDPITIPVGKFKETKFYHKVTFKTL